MMVGLSSPHIKQPYLKAATQVKYASSVMTCVGT